MDLEQLLATTAQATRGPIGHVEKLLAKMDPEEAATCRNILRSGDYQHAHLARALTIRARELGVIGAEQTIHGGTVARWREVNGHR